MIVAQLDFNEEEEAELRALLTKTSEALGRNVFMNELLKRIITAYLRELKEVT